MNSKRSWIVWGVAVFAYLVAVLERTSLGVAGVQAADRFGVSASILSTLAVVQLVIYAGLQIPVGVMLDRFGPRFVIATGAAFLLGGQVVLALSPSIGVAIVGRVLVGAGDAMTFISVVRLLSSWFSGRSLPQVLQWTGVVGQLGQVLSAIPLVVLLHLSGWTPAFLSAAAFAALSCVLVVIIVSDAAPDVAHTVTATNWGEAMHQLRDALRRPGTQLGFWSHFVSQSPGGIFTLLWGFPMLTAGLGYSAETASGVLTFFVVVGLVFGPLLGLLSARFPLRRSNLILLLVSIVGVCWTAVLLWPGHPPFWLVLLLVVAIGVAGPASMIGFDFARTFNPLRSLGSANGFVNIGGFSATFVMMFLIGIVLDLLDQGRIARGLPSQIFAWDSFRIAFCVQYVIVGTGIVFLLLARRRTRRGMREEGIQVAPIWVSFSRAWRRGRL